MDWILCTERLPEENVPVLICSEKRYKNDISFNLIAVGWLERFDWGGTDFFSYDDMWNHGKVIAWMPLPQPYKADLQSIHSQISCSLWNKGNNMTENKKVRPCKGSWEYCNGNCAECEKSHVTISDHTE